MDRNAPKKKVFRERERERERERRKSSIKNRVIENERESFKGMALTEATNFLNGSKDSCF